MATSDTLPSNAAIWSGRKLKTPKVIKAKRKPLLIDTKPAARAKAAKGKRK